jgi:hypothetical protein
MKKKSKILTTVFAMLLCVALTISLAACGGNSDDDGDGQLGSNTVVQNLSKVRDLFLQASESIDEVCGVMETAAAEAQPQNLAMSLSAVSIVPLADKPEGDGNDKAGFTLDDIEGYFLMSAILDRIDFYFAAADGDFQGGQFAYYLKMFVALENKFAESEETELTDNGVKFQKIKDGYNVISPIFNTTEGYKDQVTGYFKLILTGTVNGVSISSGKCDANGKAVSGELADEYKFTYKFEVSASKARMEAGYPEAQFPDQIIEVIEEADGTYVQFYAGYLAKGGEFMRRDTTEQETMFLQWEQYAERESEEGIVLPTNPYIRLKLATDKQTGTMLIIRQFTGTLFNLLPKTKYVPSDGKGGGDTYILDDSIPLPFPASWFNIFNKETALSFGDMVFEVNDFDLSQSLMPYVGIFNYSASVFPQGNK